MVFMVVNILQQLSTSELPVLVRPAGHIGCARRTAAAPDCGATNADDDVETGA